MKEHQITDSSVKDRIVVYVNYYDIRLNFSLQRLNHEILVR